MSFSDSTPGTQAGNVPLGDAVPVTLDPTGRIGTASITVSDLAAGERRITAFYNGFYGYAPDDPKHLDPIESFAAFTRLTQTMLRTQTISFNSAPAVGVVDGSTDRPTASSTSELPVRIEVVPDSRGICSLAEDGVLTYLQGGTCVLEASQDGNEEYAAAPTVALSIPVTGATSQTITFTTTPPATMEGGQTYVPRAVGGGSGNPVVITTFGGRCTIADGTVVARLGGRCFVRAHQAAGGGFSAADAEQEIRINPVPGYLQFETAPPESRQIGDQYTAIGRVTYPSAAWGTGAATLSLDPTSTACTLGEEFWYSDAGGWRVESVITYTDFGDCVVDLAVLPDSSLPPSAVQPIAQRKQISRVDAEAQQVTFTSDDPADAAYGGSTTVSATSSSGLPVQFSSATPATCRMSGRDVTFVGAGECEIHADQNGQAPRWAAAPTTSTTFSISPAVLTVTAPSGASVYGATPITFKPSYEGFVGEDDPSSLTERPTCALRTAFPDAGSHQVTCSGGVDANYFFVYIAGAQAVAKASQEVAFTSTAPTDAIVDGTYKPVLSGGGSSSPMVVGTDTPDVCRVADGVVTFVARGTCQVSVGQDGDVNYQPADAVMQEVTVAGLPQVIVPTSSVPTGAVVGGTYRPTATGGGSGVAVQIAVSTPQRCVVTDGLVSFVGAGSCEVVFSQGGSSRYEPAPEVTQTVSVEKSSQRVVFTSTAPNDAVVGDTYTPTVRGGGSSAPVVLGTDTPEACTVAGGVVTFVDAGDCVLIATQGGDHYYAAATPARQSLTVREPTPPVVEPPVIEPPITEPPVTEPPVVDPPVVEPPLEEEPTAAELAVVAAKDKVATVKGKVSSLKAKIKKAKKAKQPAKTKRLAKELKKAKADLRTAKKRLKKAEAALAEETAAS